MDSLKTSQKRLTTQITTWPGRMIGMTMGVLAVVCIAFVPVKAENIPIRIGWQVAWATQGQIVQTLKHTNILELNGLKGNFSGFTYGAPLNEAALAGQIDVGFAADLPTASLIARGGKFKIVARLMDFRAAIIVPLKSNIKETAGLKGKTIAIPFGSTTHRMVLGMIREAGLDPGKDLKIINLDIAEQSSVVLAGTDKKWKGNIDALASWDPNIAIFEDKGLARVLQKDLGLAVVYMSEDFIKKHNSSAVSFLKAYIEAYYYYIRHQSQANQWFMEEARIKFDPALLNIVASFEPNINAQKINDIHVELNSKHIKMMKDGADFAYSLKLITVKPDMKSAVDDELLSQALHKIKKTPLNFNKVKLK